MKKKIIQIGGNLRINGISAFIMTLYRKLYQSYEFIFINVSDGKGYYREEIEALGGKVYDVHAKGKGLLRSLRQAKAIREIIRKERPDVVHSHYYSNNGLYLKQAYSEKVPVRISHCHQANINGLSFGKHIAKSVSKRMVDKYATHKFACSDAARRFFYKNGGEVIYNAVDYERFSVAQSRDELTKKYGFDAEKKYFLFVGRFSEQKNIDFLLRLCKGLKDNKSIVFLLVGHGSLQADIEAYIKSELLDNVKLLPPDSNVAELLAVSHALLLPSLFEGLPITLIEAQAVGVKCLASDRITEEAQLGLVEYLPLDYAAWINRIAEISAKEPQPTPLKNSTFDHKYQAALFSGIYDNIDSDEWILRGKEYSIGSKRFYRSKELSLASFYRAHMLGNVRGTFYFALGCFEGNGIEKDRERAQKLVAPIVKQVERYAKEQRPEYLVILGDMYSFGLGKEQSYEKAFELYSIAAKLGNLEAMCDLGYMYLVGQGVATDKYLSSHWYKTSADLGYVHSMRDIGQNYLNGDGVAADAKEAVRYFQMASDNNYSHGTGDLAYCYMNGIGVEKNSDKAKDCFLLALRQDAERTMRDLFAYGVDVVALKQNNELKFLDNTEITEISVQNTYAETLCVSSRIAYVDPSCLYSSKVKKIFVEKDNQAYCVSNGVLYSKDKKTLVRFPLASPEKTFVVPYGVQTIGEYAFQNARNLEHVTLPETVKIIESSAFDDCKKLIDVLLPTSLQSIGAWAFHGCDKLQQIALPRYVTKIDKYAFGSCESLAEISIPIQNEFYCCVDGNLYTKGKSVLLQYAIGKSDTQFKLPNETKEIAFRALSDAFNLQYIDLNNVQIVEDKAFYYATALRKISYNGSVQFGQDVFGHTPQDLQKEIR